MFNLNKINSFLTYQVLYFLLTIDLRKAKFLIITHEINCRLYRRQSIYTNHLNYQQVGDFNTNQI